MSKSGFLLSATIYLGELQGQSQKTSLVSLSWDYNNADQTRMKFLKNSLGRVWAHQLRKPVQKSLPNWQEPEILLALVPEVTSCPEARSAGVTKEIYLWLSFPVAAEFYINQTCKFTHAISIGFSEAGVCFVAEPAQNFSEIVLHNTWEGSISLGLAFSSPSDMLTSIFHLWAKNLQKSWNYKNHRISQVGSDA